MRKFSSAAVLVSSVVQTIGRTRTAASTPSSCSGWLWPTNSRLQRPQAPRLQLPQAPVRLQPRRAHPRQSLRSSAEPPSTPTRRPSPREEPFDDEELTPKLAKAYSINPQLIDQWRETLGRKLARGITSKTDADDFLEKARDDGIVLLVILHEMCGKLNEHSRQTITDSINNRQAHGDWDAGPHRRRLPGLPRGARASQHIVARQVALKSRRTPRPR